MTSSNDAPKRRAKEDVPRPHRIMVRLSDQEHDIINAACAVSGLSPGTYVALAAIRAATIEVAESKFTVTLPRNEYVTSDLTHLTHHYEELEPGQSIKITKRG